MCYAKPEISLLCPKWMCLFSGVFGNVLGGKEMTDNEIKKDLIETKKDKSKLLEGYDKVTRVSIKERTRLRKKTCNRERENWETE